MSPLTLPRAVLRAAGFEMETAGVRGAEATALLVAGADGVIRRAIFPEQEAGEYPGCWVRVTERGKRQLAMELAAASDG